MSKENWMWLAAGLGFAAVNTGELLAAYPQGAQQVFNELGGEKMDEILTQKQAEKLASTRPEDYALMLAHAASQEIYALPYDDLMYPEMLRSIANPPLILFVKGDISLLNGQLCVGMVGARRPSGYGMEAMKTIGRGVALGGAIIVSGLAAGLDSEAHKAALAVNGPTIACIAFGHEHCYPAQNKKLMEVIERYGVVISEYPPSIKPEKSYFLHRNRLIAGLSHALVVAEARKHSGTMSTVNFAVDYGRDVFAVPGSIFSELSSGTNAMIRDGAYLAANANDVLSLYGVELPEEDLAKAAAIQAQEGRPSMVPATPPWKQSEPRVEPVQKREPQAWLPEGVSPEEVKLGEQTLIEALQNQLDKGSEKAAGDRISRGAAIDAFRRLQQEIPSTTDSELDARNRALDEMAAAVSDDVDIRRTVVPKPPGERSERRRAWEKMLEDDAPEKKKKEKIKPFQWDTLEHLTKEEVLRKEAENQKKAAAQSPVVPRRQGTSPAYGIPGGMGGLAPISPVSAVGPVAVAHNVAQIAPVAAENPQRVQRYAATAPPEVRKDKVVIPEINPPSAPRRAGAAESREATAQKRAERPTATRPESRPALGGSRREEESLAGKLRTLQKHPEPGNTASPFGGYQERREDAGVYRPKAKAPAAAAAPMSSGAGQVRKPGEGNRPLVTTAFQPTPPPSVMPPAQPPSTRFEFPEPSERSEEEALGTVSAAARLAFAQLGVNPVSLARISERSGLSPGEAMAALTELELAGLSRQLPGRQFVIMQ